MGAGRVVAAMAALLAIVCPSAAQTVVPPEIYQSPQRLVAVDGSRRLNLYCAGSGRPTVFLEAGSGNGMVVWRLVQAEIAKFTQVCAYDRAGLGFSDAATRPSDVRNMTDDLHRLLLAADIPRPIVFVGHSLWRRDRCSVCRDLSGRIGWRGAGRTRVRRNGSGAAGRVAACEPDGDRGRDDELARTPARVPRSGPGRQIGRARDRGGEAMRRPRRRRG